MTAGPVDECAALRAEVERLQRRLFPAQGDGYANEVERQRNVIDGMKHAAETYKAERDEARAQLAAVRAALETSTRGFRLSGLSGTFVEGAGGIHAAVAAALEVSPPEPETERPARPQLHPKAVRERATVALDGSAGPTTDASRWTGSMRPMPDPYAAALAVSPPESEAVRCNGSWLTCEKHAPRSPNA